MEAHSTQTILAYAGIFCATYFTVPKNVLIDLYCGL